MTSSFEPKSGEAGSGDGDVRTMPAGPPARAFGGAGADIADAVIRTLEGIKPLTGLAQTLQSIFNNAVHPGKVKDALSGTWMGHPAHPMLTDVTIGSWTSALMLDLFGGRKAAPGADALVGLGVLSALPTALTGLSDLADFGTEPEQALGAAHALGNITAVALYAASFVARKSGSRLTGIALSMAGAAAMTGAAFLGGHLSFRKGIGVDHNAFEWPVEDWTPVCDESELTQGQPHLVDAQGHDVLLYRSASGSILALADRCGHAGGPLHEGSVEDGQVTCPWHASVFNLADGSVARGPATSPQPCFQARVRDGKVEVRSRM